MADLTARLGAASAGSQASTNSQTFTNMPAEAGGTPFFGIWSVATSGTYEAGVATYQWQGTGTAQAATVVTEDISPLPLA